MKKALFFISYILLTSNGILAQGYYNHVWLTGNNPFTGFPNGRITFDSTSYVHNPEMRPMSFWGTEATICNAQGDFLMSTNGIWIANANNDTMMYGKGLNPGSGASSWPYGLPMTSNVVFLPYPDDTLKYILIHHSQEQYGAGYPAFQLYKTVIDVQLDSGLGAVINKNEIILEDTLNWGIGCVKHANGRDWWVLMVEQASSKIYKLLITPYEVITASQSLPNAHYSWFNGSQIPFTMNGDRFSYTANDSINHNSYIVTANFDRCTGNIYNDTSIQLTFGTYLWGTAFSASGNNLYACTSEKVFQIKTDSMTVDTIAYFDGFISPPGQTCCETGFWNMYLAANSKIYITSGSSVQHIHEMNYPDSSGVACDLQQHAIDLGSYQHLRAVPNHPNYNLEHVVGSFCDTLGVGLPEMQHDFHFGVFPNPTDDGFIKIIYLLPQNQPGAFEIYNITGQLVYRMNLPQWSTMQFIQLPEFSNGVYSCVIKSGYERAGKKLVVVR
ncbi:MAG: T9SS type A sorting domain-containing protein [Bacteroidia bacterium]|nr:T9SS type A sorting domain-containing protein [Bacteroidia bacterium]